MLLGTRLRAVIVTVIVCQNVLSFSDDARGVFDVHCFSWAAQMKLRAEAPGCESQVPTLPYSGVGDEARTCYCMMLIIAEC